MLGLGADIDESRTNPLIAAGCQDDRGTPGGPPRAHRRGSVGAGDDRRARAGQPIARKARCGHKY